MTQGYESQPCFQVLFDELVLPESPITDYVTQFSGITVQMMAGVTTSLLDIQVRFFRGLKLRAAHAYTLCAVTVFTDNVCGAAKRV